MFDVLTEKLLIPLVTSILPATVSISFGFDVPIPTRDGWDMLPSNAR